MFLHETKTSLVNINNGLLPDRHKDIIWTNADILLTEPLAENFSEIWIIKI